MSIRFVNPTALARLTIVPSTGYRGARATIRFPRRVVPRVSAQHEQEVRERIVRAATASSPRRVIHRATIAGHRPRQRPVGRGDLHRTSGKDELIPRPATSSPARGARRARPRRLAPVDDYRRADRDRRPPVRRDRSSRLATGGPVWSRSAWARRPTASPAIREMLARSARATGHGAGQMLLQPGRRPRRAAGLARDRCRDSRPRSRAASTA